jgi:tetratricopeptide (TPR) repeat protein
MMIAFLVAAIGTLWCLIGELGVAAAQGFPAFCGPSGAPATQLQDIMCRMRATIGVLLSLAAISAAQIRLETGKPDHRRMGGGPDSFTLDLNKGEYVEILAEQTSVDLVLRLAGPDGKQIQEVNDLGIGGTELLIQLADAGGEYGLEVRAVREGAAGDYVLRLAVRRAADPRDREVAQADARFRQLLAANSADSAEEMEEFAGAFGRLGIVRRQARAFSASGRMRAAKYSWDRAFADSGKALEAWRVAGDRAGEGSALINLGAVCDSMSQYEKAIGFWEQALAIYREVKDRAREGAVLNNLGVAYMRLSQYEKAMGYQEQALAIAREAKDRAGEGSALINLGVACHSMSQYEKAIGFWEQALGIYREVKDRAKVAC